MVAMPCREIVKTGGALGTFCAATQSLVRAGGRILAGLVPARPVRPLARPLTAGAGQHRMPFQPGWRGRRAGGRPVMCAVTAAPARAGAGGLTAGRRRYAAGKRGRTAFVLTDVLSVKAPVEAGLHAET
jgi:hypothetical protein